MEDERVTRALRATIRSQRDDIIGALMHEAYALSKGGRTRLDIMALMWALQTQNVDPLDAHELGLVGDFSDRLLGQCRPEHIVRLAHDPIEQASFELSVRLDAQLWRPPIATATTTTISERLTAMLVAIPRAADRKAAVWATMRELESQIEGAAVVCGVLMARLYALAAAEWMHDVCDAIDLHMDAASNAHLADALVELSSYEHSADAKARCLRWAKSIRSRITL